jgi:hypothetical protein
MYKIAHSNKIDGFLCQGMHLKKMMVSMTKNTLPSIKIIKFVVICSSPFSGQLPGQGFLNKDPTIWPVELDHNPSTLKAEPTRPFV